MAINEEDGKKISAHLHPAIEKYFAKKVRSTAEVANVACIVVRLIQSEKFNNGEIARISGESAFFVCDIRFVIHYVLRKDSWSNEKIHKKVSNLPMPIIQSIREELTRYSW